MMVENLGGHRGHMSTKGQSHYTQGQGYKSETHGANIFIQPATLVSVI